MVDDSRVILHDECLHWWSAEAVLHASELHCAECSLVRAAAVAAWEGARGRVLCARRTMEAEHGGLSRGAAKVKRYAGWDVLQRHCLCADRLPQSDVHEAG